MKILVVHNDYGRYSGEEAAVDSQIDHLRSEGHSVQCLRLSSEGSRNTVIGNIRGFLAGIYSFRGRRMMRHTLRTFRPNAVYFHNLYPFISPSVLPICHKHSCEVVMFVHNYRLICPTGLFLRKNQPCETCLERGNEWACIKHNCENNIFRSIGYALRNAVARKKGFYKKNVDRYVCLTEFQRSKLVAAGFDETKITVNPIIRQSDNLTIQQSDNPIIHKSDRNYVGYAGRLSAEKGWDMLLEVARRHPEIEFRFAGEFREGEAEKHGFNENKIPNNVIICGKINSDAMGAFYRDARFIVLPSRCYEGFPMIVTEAFSQGRCCIAPSHGAFPEVMSANGIVGGLLFEPLNIDDLESKILDLWNNDILCNQLCENATIVLKSHLNKS